jgi:hypothetical protein
VTRRLKAGLVEEEKTSIARLQQPKQPAIARQWRCKHISAITVILELLEKKHTTIKELLEAAFSTWFTLMSYTRDQNGAAVSVSSRNCE